MKIFNTNSHLAYLVFFFAYLVFFSIFGVFLRSWCFFYVSGVFCIFVVFFGIVGSSSSLLSQVLST